MPRGSGLPPSRRIVLVGAGAVLFVTVWLLVGLHQVLTASNELEAARDSVRRWQQARPNDRGSLGVADLESASEAFDAAERRLSSRLVAPVRVLPVIGDDISVLATLSSAGADATNAGVTVLTALEQLPGGPAGLAPGDGRIPVELYDDLAAPLDRADALLQVATDQVASTAGVPVYAEVAAAREQMQGHLPGLRDAVHQAAALAEVMPGFLGSGSTREYLFLAQNPAEARGTGGLVGAYSVLHVRDGRLRFEPFRQIQELPDYNVAAVSPPTQEYARRYNRYGAAGFWLNINMTPDHPTAARAMLSLFAKGTGRRLDGVVVADPHAFQRILATSGPTRVPPFGRIGADNVVDVVSNRAHAEIGDSAVRKRLLGAVAVGAFENFLRQRSADDPVGAVRAIADAVQDGHLLLYAGDKRTQRAFEEAEVAGALLDPAGDFFAVIGNAASAAKIDYYVQRTVTHDVQLLPDGSAQGRSTVRLDNHAPARGVSGRVIGPNARGLRAGEHRLILSLYIPDGTDVTAFRRSVGHQSLEQDHELGHRVLTTVAEVDPSGFATLTIDWKRRDAWDRHGAGGDYVLTVQGQPTVRPTRLRVRVAIPAGMRLEGVPVGMSPTGGGGVSYTGSLHRKAVFRASFQAPMQ